VEQAGEVDYLITWRDNEFVRRVSLTPVHVVAAGIGLSDSNNWMRPMGGNLAPPSTCASDATIVAATGLAHALTALLSGWVGSRVHVLRIGCQRRCRNRVNPCAPAAVIPGPSTPCSRRCLPETGWTLGPRMDHTRAGLIDPRTPVRTCAATAAKSQ
jgi:hypothetical protein